MMRIYRTFDYREMSKRAAEIIGAQIVLKPDSVIGLATGSTPVGTYKYLIQGYQNKELDFSEITTVNLDEYKGLNKENEQSYYYFMYHHLFKDINIRMENVNIPDGTKEDGEAECRRYENVIKQCREVDLQLLGLGHNGHIGFNEPTEEFPKETHCVKLTESTIEANKRFFATVDDVPRYAYTMGIKTIMNAEKILLIVSGEDKAEILKKALYGPVTPLVPASILQMHKNLIVVADEPAMSLIK